MIPGAEVTLVNEDTNAARSAMTNEVGEYAFASVLPGTYTVRVSLPGFRTEERKGSVSPPSSRSCWTSCSRSARSPNRSPSPARRRSSTAPTASVATTLTAAQLTAIPIFGRNTFYTAIATPSVIQSGDPQFVRYQDQSGSSLLSLGGGPRRGNAYLIEGVSITDFINRASWVPSTEAVEDMRVQLKTYDAEMGRAAGGVFNVTAKSGSNAWHGSALFINKPGWATGTLFFAKRAGTPNPPQDYYSWAGSVGGPIKTGKTFFWFSKDDYKQKSTRNNVLTFPTLRERAGDFSQSGITIYDPLTTQTEPERHRLHPRSVPRQRHPGRSAQPDRARDAGRRCRRRQSGRSFTGSAILDDGPQDQETLKIDHRWSDRWTTTGMYGHQYTKEPGSAFWGPHGTIPADPSGTTLFRTVHFFSTNQIIVPNNTTAIAIRYGYNRFDNDGTNFAGGFDASTLGYPGELHQRVEPTARFRRSP